jgi:hypothetical protein
MLLVTRMQELQAEQGVNPPNGTPRVLLSVEKRAPCPTLLTPPMRRTRACSRPY